MLSKNLEVALVDFSSMGALEYADLKAMQRTFDNPRELQNLFDAAIQEILVSMHNPNEIKNEISDENDMSEKPIIVSQLLCNLDAFLVQELVATLVPTKFFLLKN